MKKLLIIMLAAAGIVFGLTKADLIQGESFIVLAEEEVDAGEDNSSSPPGDDEKPEEKPELPQEEKTEPQQEEKTDLQEESESDPAQNKSTKTITSTKKKTNSKPASSSINKGTNSSGSSGTSTNNRKSQSTNQSSTQQGSEQTPVPRVVQEEAVLSEPEELPEIEPIEQEVEEEDIEEDLEEETDEEEVDLDINKLKQREVMIRQEDGKFYVIYKDDDDNVVKQEITKEEAIELGYEDNELLEKEDEHVDNIALMSNSSNSKLKKIFGMIAVTFVSIGLMAGTYLYYRRKVA